MSLTILSKHSLLKTLSFKDNFVDLATAKYLVKVWHHWPLIEEINLSDCAINAASATITIDAVKDLASTHLQVLDLSGNDFLAKQFTAEHMRLIKIDEDDLDADLIGDDDADYLDDANDELLSSEASSEVNLYF